MANRMRLLGVFVPSNRNIPTEEKRNVLAVPVVEAPPFTKERRDELDSKMAYYYNLSDEEIKTLIRQRGIGLRGRRTREHWINALEGPVFLQEWETYEAWRGKAKSSMQIQRTPRKAVPHKPTPKETDHIQHHARMKEIHCRRDGMLASQYKAEPGRTSFLDLPAEIRNMVYDIALFGGKPHKHMRIQYCPGRDILLSSRRRYYGDFWLEENTLDVVEMMSVINKKIRHEFRTYFYAHMEFDLLGGWKQPMDAYMFNHHFVRKIGPAGRASIPELSATSCGGLYLDVGMNGVNTFKSMLDSVAMCRNLKHFSLELAVLHIFMPDIEQLKAYFLRGEPLASPSLEAFSNTLLSLEALRRVDITMRSMPEDYVTLHSATDDEAFSRFAFSEIREHILWAAFDEYIQGNNVLNNGDNVARKLGHITVWTRFEKVEELGGDSGGMLDYAAWLDWYKAYHAENPVKMRRSSSLNIYA